MHKPEKARTLFDSGFNCAQAVFAAFAPEIGMPEETALKVATSFGGGIGGRGYTCGAVTGALMVLGLQYGRTTVEDEAARNTTYAKIDTFEKLFRDRFAEIECSKLIGCDMGNPAERAAAKEAGLLKERCPEFVEESARIVEQLLTMGN